MIAGDGAVRKVENLLETVRTTSGDLTVGFETRHAQKCVEQVQELLAKKESEIE